VLLFFLPLLLQLLLQQQALLTQRPFQGPQVRGLLTVLLLRLG
jgi:hypothetical protein